MLLFLLTLSLCGRVVSFKSRSSLAWDRTSRSLASSATVRRANHTTTSEDSESDTGSTTESGKVIRRAEKCVDSVDQTSSCLCAHISELNWC